MVVSYNASVGQIFLDFLSKFPLSDQICAVHFVVMQIFHIYDFAIGLHCWNRIYR